MKLTQVSVGALVGLGAVLAASQPVLAQRSPVEQTAPSQRVPGGPGGRGFGRGHGRHGGMARLAKALQLTPDQVTQIKALHKDEHSKMREIRGNNALSSEEKRRSRRLCALMQIKNGFPLVPGTSGKIEVASCPRRTRTARSGTKGRTSARIRAGPRHT